MQLLRKQRYHNLVLISWLSLTNFFRFLSFSIEHFSFIKLYCYKLPMLHLKTRMLASIVSHDIQFSDCIFGVGGGLAGHIL